MLQSTYCVFMDIHLSPRSSTCQRHLELFQQHAQGLGSCWVLLRMLWDHPIVAGLYTTVDTVFTTVYPLVNIHNYGKSQFLMGKSTISMVIFNSYVKLPEGMVNLGMVYYCLNHITSYFNVL